MDEQTKIYNLIDKLLSTEKEIEDLKTAIKAIKSRVKEIKNDISKVVLRLQPGKNKFNEIELYNLLKKYNLGDACNAYYRTSPIYHYATALAYHNGYAENTIGKYDNLPNLHSVYLLIDDKHSNCEIVYVGKSSCPRARLKQHAKEKYGWTRWEAFFFDTAYEALESEASAIKRLQPRLNKVGL